MQLHAEETAEDAMGFHIFPGSLFLSVSAAAVLQVAAVSVMVLFRMLTLKLIRMSRREALHSGGYCLSVGRYRAGSYGAI